MTTEVAIINAQGVALAADSAVTVGGKKIYNSALKLFALSKTEPVGVMIYGSANLLDVPWETLIKLFRKNIHNQSFSTLQEYGIKFIEYLNHNHSFFSEKSQENWIVQQSCAIYNEITQDVTKKVYEEAKRGISVSEDESKKLMISTINEYHELLSKNPKTIRLNSTQIKKLRTTISNLVESKIEKFFSGFFLDKKTISTLNKIALLCITNHPFHHSNSGIVIAGFGENDLYASVETYEIAGIFIENLIYRKIENKCIEAGLESKVGIVAFAQEDMVATFMQGVNPSIFNYMNNYLSEIFSKFIDNIDLNIISDESIRLTTQENLIKDSKTILDSFKSRMQSIMRSEHVDPVVGMVASLPKDELAAMAESLVNLTAFKRKMTESVETVGGPIDVAVISKGDGLVWVKRKHYFPAELNQHFFKNYFR